MDIAGSMNITFTADLTHLVGHRPSVLYWVLQPGSDVGGIGAGLVRMVRPWNEWLIVWGYDIAGDPPQLDDAAAAEIVRQLVGVDGPGRRDHRLLAVGQQPDVRTHLQQGRVFCAGDAVHRHPPSNGLGSNTSVQDSYNLAWKIAAVLNGQAAPSLLDTYSTERAPVAEQIVLRANKSGRRVPVHRGARRARRRDAGGDAGRHRRAQGEHPGGRGQAGGPRGGHGPEELRVQRPRRGHGPVLRVRRGRLRRFRPSPSTSATPSSTTSSPPPGRAVPARLGGRRDGHKRSTQDLVPYGSSRWSPASRARPGRTPPRRSPSELGVPLGAVVIGPGREVIDTYYDWAKMRGRRGVGRDPGPSRTRTWPGARRRSPTTRRAALGDALATVLGRGEHDGEHAASEQAAEEQAAREQDAHRPGGGVVRRCRRRATERRACRP